MVQCKTETCRKPSRYGYDYKVSLACEIHKLNDMVNVIAKRCIESDCETQASYGIKNGERMYCRIHMLPNMHNLKNKLCIGNDCNKQPVFGKNGNRPEYCKEHMLFGMENLSKKCNTIDCNKHPAFGIPGEKYKYCREHMITGMVNLNQQKCIKSGCKTQPKFGNPGGKVEYCSKHMLNKMIDVVSKRCTSCNLFTAVKANNFLCSYCSPRKPQKTKEMVIKDLLDKHNYKFIHNKEIGNSSCNKYRPDFLFDCGSYFVVLEIDEDAHKHYDKDCEFVRMNNIVTDLGLPALFIRYNPDLKEVRKSHKQKILLETLDEHLNKDFNEQIEPIYLFYSN